MRDSCRGGDRQEGRCEEVGGRTWPPAAGKGNAVVCCEHRPQGCSRYVSLQWQPQFPQVWARFLWLGEFERKKKLLSPLLHFITPLCHLSHLSLSINYMRIKVHVQYQVKTSHWATHFESAEYLILNFQVKFRQNLSLSYQTTQYQPNNRSLGTEINVRLTICHLSHVESHRGRQPIDNASQGPNRSLICQLFRALSLSDSWLLTLLIPKSKALSDRSPFHNHTL